MNKFLKSIETEGHRYGLRLNKEKCELLNLGKAGNIHFKDGVKVPTKTEVKYLGALLNTRNDTDKEIKQRIGQCMGVLNKLNTFWRHSNCTAKFKLLVQDAVVRSKLLYGLV
jgi:hypothetical protein